VGAGFVCKAKGSKAGEILIYEDVGEGFFGGVSAKQFSAELADLGDVTALDVRINSYGGDVFDGLAIYNALVRHPATVTTHVDGIAASIASVIAMAGDTINIAESGWMMVHDAWGMAIGNARDMRDMADKLEATSQTIGNVYAARTGRSKDIIAGYMAEELWLDAPTAIAEGFATAMTENLKMAARAVPERFAFRHMPRALQDAAVTQQRRGASAGAENQRDALLRFDLQRVVDRVRRNAALAKTRGPRA
jgi:ATP-dependent Clp protease, protease subunit